MYSNKKNVMKFFKIRPALVELEGKLFGINCEIHQQDYTFRFICIVDQDILRINRNLIPKKSIYSDLMERYAITKEAAQPYLNCLSYRDYLELDPR